jgi:uncharacterized membrane protein YbhN (UPF0104 family)
MSHQADTNTRAARKASIGVFPKVTMKWLKWGLAIVLFGVLIYSFLPLLSELRQAAKLFLTAQWIWLLVAIIIQFLSYASLTLLNVLALEPFNGKIGFWNLTAVLTSMAFIQIAKRWIKRCSVAYQAVREI